ncbi:hypothetical protein [Ruminococcus sp.]|uniref:hypothetical protein n=1 Tax=Ruminococcus sp. TaxID=41978 RepID=UPI0025CE74BF|nr:hypothetical protein [Ruminococcus sp.]MBQ6251864.1 hypothetical protein [Ruminococcus sp.]
MKKGLLGLSALVFAAALVGCGADKNKDSEKETKSSKAETTAAAEDTTAADETEADTNEKKEEEKGSSAESVDLKDLAGAYHLNGYMTMGDVPEELDPKQLKETYKDDPVSISEDGVLHLYGKDYKLAAEGMDDEDTVFSIEGSGFDMESYRNSSKVSDKDYEGPCALIVQVSHMTVNDADVPYTQYNVLLTQKGDEDYFGYVGIDAGEDSDWDWDWDDDDE